MDYISLFFPAVTCYLFFIQVVLLVRGITKMQFPKFGFYLETPSTNELGERQTRTPERPPPHHPSLVSDFLLPLLILDDLFSLFHTLTRIPHSPTSTPLSFLPLPPLPPRLPCLCLSPLSPRHTNIGLFLGLTRQGVAGLTLPHSAFFSLLGVYLLSPHRLPHACHPLIPVDTEGGMRGWTGEGERLC